MIKFVLDSGELKQAKLRLEGKISVDEKPESCTLDYYHYVGTNFQITSCVTWSTDDC